MRAVRIAIVVGLCLVPAGKLAGANLHAIGASLDKAYAGKTMTLRVFHPGSVLRYSTARVFLGHSKPGPWTLDAFIKEKHIKLKPNELLIRGRRMYFVFVKKAKKLEAFLGPPVTIKILIDPNTVSVASLQLTIAKIFVSGNEKFADLVPGYWKEYLTHPRLFNLDDPPKKLNEEIGALMGMHALTKDQLMKHPNAITPKVLQCPEPHYTEEALRAKLHGKVMIGILVGEDGKVKKEIIAKPLGLGLDDEAAKTIQTWKFRPAQRDGKLVPVEIMVTCSFKCW